MKFTQTFTGIGVEGVSELLDLFGREICHDWNKVSGQCQVDFESEEEAANFIANHDWRCNDE